MKKLPKWVMSVMALAVIVLPSVLSAKCKCGKPPKEGINFEKTFVLTQPT